MTRLALSLACCNYDRTAALFDGRVGVEGCDVVAVALEPEELFHRAFSTQDFDVTELSFSSTLIQTARGACPYVALPAFVSRLFRHSAIYIRTDRGIATPQDLKGKTIGVPEYQMTAALWVRGILADEYGVAPSDIHWRNGGLEQPGRRERTPISLPPHIELKPIGPDQTLSGLLARGELDAVVGARAPSCFTRGMPGIGRLFPDYRTAEAAYFRKTGMFPIMHLIGVRRSLVERHPWLAASVYKAFVEAKRLCMAELAQIGHLHATLPWLVSEVEATKALMGDDYWRYGVAENAREIEAMVRYSRDQGLIERLVAPTELFAAATASTTKI
jgi:4,5-dihydroxyphthalate decarboxylase